MTDGYIQVGGRVTEAGARAARAGVRKKALALAANGTDPRTRLNDTDLNLAFEDHPDELATVYATLAEVQAETHARRVTSAQRREAQKLARQILREQDEQRERDALTEAYKRLGIEDPA